MTTVGLIFGVFSVSAIAGSFIWAIPAAFGPLLAGMIMDYLNPDWVWYASFITAGSAGFIYLWLSGKTRKLDAAQVHA